MGRDLVSLPSFAVLANLPPTPEGTLSSLCSNPFLQPDDEYHPE